jgi:hypothetical protein
MKKITKKILILGAMTLASTQTFAATGNIESNIAVDNNTTKVSISAQANTGRAD